MSWPAKVAYAVGSFAVAFLAVAMLVGAAFAESAFPNGRALEDDVTDTLLTVVCNNGGPLGDAVDENDLAFFDEMPYLATPHSGNPIP